MVVGGVDVLVNPVMVTGFSLLGALSTRNDDPKAASRPFDTQRVGRCRNRMTVQFELAKVTGARHAIIHERTGKYLTTIGVIRHVFHQGLTGGLGDAAMHLPVDQ